MRYKKVLPSSNISAPILHQSNYVVIVLKKLKPYQIPPSNVTLEVIESSIINDFHLAIENLEKLVSPVLTIADKPEPHFLPSDFQPF